MNRFYSFARFLLYLPVRMLFPTKVINKQDFPKKTKKIFVSNHLSWTDIPVTAIYFPGYRRFVAKKELGKKPFVYKLTKSLGTIFIDRGKADMSSMRDIIKVLKNGDSITIFPEGTRNKVDSSLQQVKTGVVMFSIKGDAPIVPIYIYRKARPFRMCYIYVLPPFELDEFKDRRLDSATVAEGAEAVSEKMALAKQLMDNYMTYRKDKAYRKTLKQHKKARAAAKKALKAALA